MVSKLLDFSVVVGFVQPSFACHPPFWPLGNPPFLGPQALRSQLAHLRPFSAWDFHPTELGEFFRAWLLVVDLGTAGFQVLNH